MAQTHADCFYFFNLDEREIFALQKHDSAENISGAASLELKLVEGFLLRIRLFSSVRFKVFNVPNRIYPGSSKAASEVVLIFEDSMIDSEEIASL